LYELLGAPEPLASRRCYRGYSDDCPLFWETGDFKMRGFDIFVSVLILIGAINWGLIGFFNFNLVGAIFGPTLSRVIYAIVGLAALYEIVAWKPFHARLAPRHEARRTA
jgi:uncharacterized protein